MLNHCVVHLKLIYCKPTILPLKIQLVHQISLWTKAPRFLANTHIHTSLIRTFYFFFNMEVVVSLQCNIDPFNLAKVPALQNLLCSQIQFPPKSQVKSQFGHHNLHLSKCILSPLPASPSQHSEFPSHDDLWASLHCPPWGVTQSLLDRESDTVTSTDQGVSPQRC